MSVLKSILVVILASTLGIGVVMVNAQDDTAPAVVTIEQEGLYPEGVAYDSTNGVFLVTSLTNGGVYSVADDGTFSVIVEDERLVSAIGLKVDEANGRVLVANSDPGVGMRTSEGTAGTLAALVVYDLETGEELFYVDLGALVPNAGHFANDIALDADGNAYVTDSFSPIIYLVDVEGNAEILVQDEAFAAEGFGLNGIIYHPDGYLVVAKSEDGVLFRVPLEDPTAFTQIEVDAEFLGADGLVLTEDGNLIVVTNTNGIFSLSSDDGWASATVDAELPSGDEFPTTATVRDGVVYVLDAQLGLLFDPTNTTPAAAFNIRVLSFEE